MYMIGKEKKSHNQTPKIRKLCIIILLELVKINIRIQPNHNRSYLQFDQKLNHSAQK